MVVAVAFALIGAASAQTVPSKPAPIRIDTGLVQGVAKNGLVVYRGIPFAAPPMGELRWHPPLPSAHWKGVWRADRFAPGCMQEPAWASVVGQWRRSSASTAVANAIGK
jgi:para-nitrobenzyl esterase